MGEKIFKGKVRAKIIELRFAASGKLASIFKKRGDLVKKGELVASLDKKLLQTELDKQLGDYEKARAGFEIYNLEKGEPKDDISKYLKSQKQAELNVSVKEVEIAKARLDQTDLFSPAEGMIIDDSDLISGIYITPSSNPIKILENSSFYFEIEFDQKDLGNFLSSRLMEIRIPGLNKTYSGNTKSVLSYPDGKLRVEIPLPDSSGLILGLEGEAS